jgi:hypothetical protein
MTSTGRGSLLRVAAIAALMATGAASASKAKPVQPQNVTPDKSTTKSTDRRGRSSASAPSNNPSVSRSISPNTRNTTTCCPFGADRT